MVMAPLVRGRKGEYGKLLEELRTDGFQRVKIDDRVRMLEESIVLDKRYKHDISVVVDRLVMRHDLRKRLADSIETAVGLAEGLVEIEIVGASGKDAVARAEERPRATGAKGVRAAAAQIVPGEVPPAGTVFTFSERFACPEHGPSLVELEPRIFSFNSPHGACERCTGLGSQMEIDPELLVPDPSLSIARGRDRAVGEQRVQLLRAGRRGDRRALRRRPRRRPGKTCPQEDRDLFLYGTDGERLQISYRNRYGRRRSYATRFEGIVTNLQRRYKETDSEGTREKIEQYMSLRTCPVCGGARLRAESRAVLVGGHADRGLHRAVGAPGARVARGGRAVRDRPPRRAADPARDLRAAAVPGERRHRLPVDGPRRRDAVRRRGAAHPPGDADRLLAGGRAVHPRRALDRAAPARQLQADRNARAAARPRQHGDRGRARRADDARRRPPARPGPRRGRARRADRRAGHRRAGRSASRSR